MAVFSDHCEVYITVYGPDNYMGLTGPHETQSIDKFFYGVANRDASVRIHHSFVKDDKYLGYLEDRRPTSQGVSYQIASRILKTMSLVPNP